MPSTISVIIPVYNDSLNLAVCYRALVASTRPPDQVIVVDDGSSEPLPDPPSELNVQVLRLGAGPHGDAARNYALSIATGSLIVAVDADVAVHSDALERLERLMEEHPQVAAAFGSYDDTPAETHWVSRYRNLLHHWVHQNGAADAGTFWTGLSVIRRDVLLGLGGYDTSARTLRDIELGMRMRRTGLQIRLAPEIQGTHLKRWTLRGMLRSDICDRAVPWTRMIVRYRQLPSDLNLGHSSRVAAALAWSGLAMLLVAVWQPWALVGALAALATILTLNRRLYAFMYRRGGALFALGAAGLHLLYSSATFGIVAAHALWQERNRERKRLV